MSLILSILNQKLYPGAGDVDDCWAVATIWAYRAATDATVLPTVPEFRAAANKPDLPGPTGGNITDIMRAVAKLWPNLGVEEYEHPSWEPFVAKVKAGGIASLAVLSSLLPPALRFGFYGNHQVGVAYEGGQLLVANPLARQGSAPVPINEAHLRDAALGIANGWVLAAIFPRGGPMVTTMLTLLPYGGGKFTIPAGHTVKSFTLSDTGTVVFGPVFGPIDHASSAEYDATMVTSATRGNPFIRVTTGALAGQYIGVTGMVLVPNQPPQADCSDAVAKAIAADRANAKVEIVWPS